MPKTPGSVTPFRERSEYYRVMGGIRIKHNGIGFDGRPRKLAVGPIQFNSGPTPRHAVLDFAALVEAHPGVLDLL